MTEGTQPYSAPADGATGRVWVRPAIATGVWLVFLPVFIGAGFWQLDRATQKTALEDAFRAATEQPPLTAAVDDAAAADDYRFRPLRLEGRFDPEHQVLLDNIVTDGVNGYQVLTPFRTGNRTLMVNRGWVRANPDRRVLPTVGVSAELRTVTGLINTFPAPGMRIATDYPADAPWPRRMLYPTQTVLAEQLDRPVAGYQLLLLPDEADGYLRNWDTLDLGVDTHYGYAFQWFSFAAVATVFYVILMTRWRRDRRSA